jgi:hypothetical protein
MGVYNVSKHAVVSLSEPLHHDLGLVTGQVHASVLCPHLVPTGNAESHRNRDTASMSKPTLSQRIGQALAAKAVASGKVSAADVAALVLDAVREQRFWIFSHPQSLAGVSQRVEEIRAGRNPGDPFADRPDIGMQLRAALRG